MEGKTTTPMMEQYLELKQAHQGEVLFGWVTSLKCSWMMPKKFLGCSI
jgi:hypothetical protein